jgi:hypothetical protein
LNPKLCDRIWFLAWLLTVNHEAFDGAHVVATSPLRRFGRICPR